MTLTDWRSEESMTNRLAFNLLAIVILTIALCVLQAIYNWEQEHQLKQCVFEGGDAVCQSVTAR